MFIHQYLLASHKHGSGSHCDHLEPKRPHFGSFPPWLHESGKCALTAALNKVWAEGSCKLFIPQLAVGRDHPTCCKYPARRGEGWGGRQGRVGSLLLLSRSGLSTGCRGCSARVGDFWNWPQGRSSAVFRSFPGTWIYDWSPNCWIASSLMKTMHYGKVSMGGVTFRISNFLTTLKENITFTFYFNDFCLKLPL